MPVQTEAKYMCVVELRSMMIDARNAAGLSQKDWAERLGFTPQYICDLEQGRRLGSVQFVERVCDVLQLSPRQRREWHEAGARAHGWII